MNDKPSHARVVLYNALMTEFPRIGVSHGTLAIDMAAIRDICFLPVLGIISLVPAPL